MRSLARFAIVLLAAGLFIGSAEAAPPRRVYIRVGPPAPVVEHAVRAPHAGYIWQPGYYVWAGNRYTWTAGTWVRAPYKHARWISGRWIRTRRGYYWEPGHWVRRR
ncbi:MAG TPA: hypothetical protein VL284_04570 [Thermoanaerobaculia bacterium]|nr:hypothetical protein [Thermoanaerobaculia bacterium]